jgi:hypothetical protein
MRTTVAWVCAVWLAGCGGGGAPNDNGGGGPDGGGGGTDARVTADSGDPPEEIPPVGSGGTDDVGSCRVTDTNSLIEGTRACVDYDMGFMDGAAMTDCSGRSGAWNDNAACNTSDASYVASCAYSSNGQDYRLRFYRRFRDTGVTPAQVQAYCAANGATYDGPAVPMNTGRCRVNPTTDIADNTNTRSCTNYDTGYTESAAMNDCGAGTFEAGELCTTSGLLGGCRFEAGGRVRTKWFYAISRGGAVASRDEITTYCTANSGTFVANP